ncbi:hypothetical protein HYV12_04485 [Candidatus Dojkabacteria bacterium]|nr:hypothetical protein [Candidatus Dojkabacteria bacterium]
MKVIFVHTSVDQYQNIVPVTKLANIELQLFSSGDEEALGTLVREDDVAGVLIGGSIPNLSDMVEVAQDSGKGWAVYSGIDYSYSERFGSDHYINNIEPRRLITIIGEWKESMPRNIEAKD